MTNFARDTKTAAPTEPDALFQTLYEDLSHARRVALGAQLPVADR